MIKLNLLPREFKKVQKPKKTVKFDIPKLGPKLLKAAKYSLCVLVGLHIIVGLSVFLKSVSLKNLNSELRQVEPSKAQIQHLNEEISSLEKVVMPVRQLVAKRIPWAKELNKLSDLMVPGIWLRKLFVQTQVRDAKAGEVVRVLNLEGCVASLYGDEAAIIAKFIKALQEDKEFFKYFSEIRLGPIEKTTLDKNPVMNFKLLCYFKKD